MTKALAALLVALMFLIVVALICIFGAADAKARSNRANALAAKSPPRAHGDGHHRRRAGVGARRREHWWDQTASARSRRMIYAAPELQLSLQPDSTLQLHIGDNKWHSSRPDAVNTELIPDHGYLMHLFLIRTPGMDRFYHLHPRQEAGLDFVEDLPPFPAGHYQVFADIVRSSGFPDTMVSEIDLPDIGGKPLAGDDSETVAPPLSDVPEESSSETFPDGYRMVWERDASPLVANRLLCCNTAWKVPMVNRRRTSNRSWAWPAIGNRAIRSLGLRAHPSRWNGLDGRAIAGRTIVERRKSIGRRGPGRDASMPMSMAMPGSGDLLPATVTFPYGFPNPAPTAYSCR